MEQLPALGHSGARPREDVLAAYGTEAVIFTDMGHDVMLEPAWEDVAEHIDGWLVARGL